VTERTAVEMAEKALEMEEEKAADSGRAEMKQMSASGMEWM
jgi:hypothetical protein